MPTGPARGQFPYCQALRARARFLSEGGPLLSCRDRIGTDRKALLFHDEVHAAVLLHAGFTALEAERTVLAVTRGLELNG